MQPTVLILSEPSDVHAHAVALALRHRGVDSIFWHTPDFPSVASESVSFFKSTLSFEIGDSESSSLHDVRTVWRRRPSFVLPANALDPADREFAEQECRLFRRGLFEVLLPTAFWVNSPNAASRAGLKLVQHTAAVAIGFETPDTLYSNDPEQIRDFLASHGGRAIYKVLHPVLWRGENTSWAPYTSVVTTNQLVEDATLRLTPGIFQEVVPKSYELRVTAMGQHLFAAKILSQETGAGRLDWRKAYAELQMEPIELSAEITRKCRLLCERLGLVFGCIDLIVTPEGETVFLEINEAGQFLFVETYSGIPLLDAFTEFLSQGRTDFTWSAADVKIRYSEVREAALTSAKEAETCHVVPPDQSILEVPAQPNPPSD
ncbi:MAG: MvdC/MvdD family ATP grasp protein [Acidobacteriota bacterium]